MVKAQSYPRSKQTAAALRSELTGTATIAPPPPQIGVVTASTSNLLASLGVAKKKPGNESLLNLVGNNGIVGNNGAGSTQFEPKTTSYPPAVNNERTTNGRRPPVKPSDKQKRMNGVKRPNFKKAATGNSRNPYESAMGRQTPETQNRSEEVGESEPVKGNGASKEFSAKVRRAHQWRSVSASVALYV